MRRFGCGLVLLALAAHRVAAEPSASGSTPSAAPTAPAARSPVEITAEVHVRSIGNLFADDDALDGRGPGASVRIGRNVFHLQISWDYVHETVADPFDPVSYDEHAHQFLVGPALVSHWGSRVSASLGLGAAVAYYNGPGAPEIKTGAWGDVRFDIDVVRIARGQWLTVIVDGSLVLASPGGVAASIGLGYHLR